jgi:hypothetical protein
MRRLMLGAALLAPVPSPAATLDVDPLDPTAYATIGDAISAASDGDTVAVAAGTYEECLDTGGRSLTLLGAGSASTTLDASGLCGDALRVVSGETVSASGFTVTNRGGRGVNLYFSALTLEDVTLADSGAPGAYGGAVYTYGGTLRLTDSEVRDNQADYGGGIYLYAYTTLEVSGATFSGNEARYGGGGLYSNYDSYMTLSEVTFSGNVSAEGAGGGMTAAWYGALAIEGSTFTDNAAATSGGGIFLYAVDAVVTLTDTTLEGNLAEGGHGGGLGSEFYPDIELVDVTFRENRAYSDGGALSHFYYGSLLIEGGTFADNTSEAASGGAVLHYPYETTAEGLEIRGATFSGNSAAGNGGAVYCAWADAMSIEDSEFTGNTAGGTGGAVLYYVANDAGVHRSTFCANTASYGGAVSSQWTGVEQWTHNVFIENTALRGGAGHGYASYDDVSLYQNTFAGNTAGEYGAAWYTDYSYADFRNNVVAWSGGGTGAYANDPYSVSSVGLFYSGWYENEPLHGGGYYYVSDGVDGNVVADPGFVAWSMDGDCSNDDLRLRGDSPLRDAGDPSLSDLDGSLSDPGAWGGEGAPVEDRDGDGVDTTADCDDTDGAVLPGAEEVCGDGVDQDCDGEDPACDADTGDTGLSGDTGDTGPDPEPDTGDSGPAPVDTAPPDLDTAPPGDDTGDRTGAEGGAASDGKGCAAAGAGTGDRSLAWLLALGLGLVASRRGSPRCGGVRPARRSRPL